MSEARSSLFQKALESVEELPGYQQLDLIEIIRNRQIEERRDEIARNIRSARAEYKKGKVKRGDVSDLMKDLRS